MKKALILGATGNFGKAQARALLQDGYHLNLLMRNPDKFTDKLMLGHKNVTIFTGDALNMDDLLMAGQDCQVIVHGVNMPYDKWADLMPKVSQNIMQAAKTLNATILFAGNIYNFSPADGPLYDEQSPQQPITKKGAFRKQLEQDMAHFAQTQGVQIIVLRAGDYLGPDSSDSSMFKYLVLDNLAKGKILLAGRNDKKHTWAYLPDLGRIGAKLIAHRAELGLFEVFHHQGFDLTGQELVNAVEKAADKPLKIGKMPWGMIRIIGIFNKALGEMMELRFMSDVAQSLNQNKLQALLGSVPSTPLDEALRATFKAHNVA
ncbi:MAG: NAD(P)H-binding protein [Rhizobiales bacterium]|nr:NAD(P)H-binding protein [Hyphomicrobiales bacterium]NRB15138.1 NAD(P)H-binding protein [Hyphomicrobiales bacterium]